MPTKQQIKEGGEQDPRTGKWHPPLKPYDPSRKPSALSKATAITSPEELEQRTAKAGVAPEDLS